jgi:superfamily II DNA or RNA helicase
MTREEIEEKVLNDRCDNIMFNLPTSFGKTRISLKWVNMFHPKNILVVVPTTVLKGTWKKEILEWNPDNDIYFEFTTYMSFGKHLETPEGTTWDAVMFDECHHFSERIADLFNSLKVLKCAFLSATVNKEVFQRINDSVYDIHRYKVSIRKATEDKVLPDPRVYLLGLHLDNLRRGQTIVLRKSKPKFIECQYNERRKFEFNKKVRVIIHCTQYEKNEYYASKARQLKSRYMMTHNEIIKNQWLHIEGYIIKFLSRWKTYSCREIIKNLEGQRMLVFCSSIKQTEEITDNCIHSKNKKSDKILDSFNEGEINLISSCDKLNEGANLVNCRIGLYATLNGSQTLIDQKAGRLLRHPHPVIIIPYFKGTKDEKLIDKMLVNYNPDLVKYIRSIKEIEL